MSNKNLKRDQKTLEENSKSLREEKMEVVLRLKFGCWLSTWGIGNLTLDGSRLGRWGVYSSSSFFLLIIRRNCTELIVAALDSFALLDQYDNADDKGWDRIWRTLCHFTYDHYCHLHYCCSDIELPSNLVHIYWMLMVVFFFSQF